MSCRDFDFEEEGRDDVIRQEIEALGDYEPFVYTDDYWLGSEPDINAPFKYDS